jgi:hypothetical protein
MIRAQLDSALVRGVAEVETTPRGLRPHRLPGWARVQFPDPQLLTMESQPSGVRLAMRTTARTIEVVSHPTRLAHRGAERPHGRVDLAIDDEVVASDVLGGGDRVEVDLLTGAAERREGDAHTTRFAGCPGATRRSRSGCPTTSRSS